MLRIKRLLLLNLSLERFLLLNLLLDHILGHLQLVFELSHRRLELFRPLHGLDDVIFLLCFYLLDLLLQIANL